MKTVALLLLFELFLPNDSDKIDLFFSSHDWQCDSDSSCLKECLDTAKAESIDPEICDQILDDQGK